MSYYACLDIGGTFIKHGLADEKGHFARKGSVPTDIKASKVSGLLGKLQGIVMEYRASRELSGIAVSSPGIVDAEKGEIVFAGDNFPGYTGTKLKEELERRCGLPCEVENDVNAVGLAECWLGAGQGADSVVCVAVGTGIGGCIVLHGQLVRGAANSAGEIGFLRTETGETLEKSSSTASLVAEVAKLRGMSPEALTGEQIFADAKEGKQDAAQAIDGMVQRLATGLANVCCILNPQRIVLGGGIMAQEDYLRPRLEAALRGRLTIVPIRDSTELVFAKFRNDAAMLGALRHFLQRHSPLP